MCVRYESPGAIERISALALAISGLDAAPSAGQALFDAAVGAALAICGREDVPRAMEPALGLILADLYKDGLQRPVSSVRRGDTSITYSKGAAGAEMSDVSSLLAPFVRLRTV